MYDRDRLGHWWVPEMVLNVQSKFLDKRGTAIESPRVLLGRALAGGYLLGCYVIPGTNSPASKTPPPIKLVGALRGAR